jgi:signal peptidase I
MALSDSDSAAKKPRWPRDGLFLGSIVVLGAIVVCLRLFVFQPFSIPSQSMAPTLIPGDYVLVSKVSYGYGPYSLLLVTAGLSRRFPSDWLPERGDIVVFRMPGGTGVDFIKRVVGLPGDRIQLIRNVLRLNGVAVPRERIGDGVEDPAGQRAARYRETLPNGVSYTTQVLNDNGPFANTPEYTVPAGHYFALGDNRDNSVDSRMANQVGYVPAKNLIGRAEVTLFSGSAGGIRWDRTFQAIH